jgi:hypothetical protein
LKGKRFEMNYEDALSLLVFLTVNHFLTDFVCQTPYMLKKNAPRLRDAILPLMYHAWMVSMIFLFLTFQCPVPALVAFAVNFVSHAVIDRIKAWPQLLGRWGPSDKRFWIVLGADQMCHYLIYIVLAVYMAKGG